MNNRQDDLQMLLTSECYDSLRACGFSDSQVNAALQAGMDYAQQGAARDDALLGAANYLNAGKYSDEFIKSSLMEPLDFLLWLKLDGDGGRAATATAVDAVPTGDTGDTAPIDTTDTTNTTDTTDALKTVCLLRMHEMMMIMHMNNTCSPMSVHA